MLLTFAGITVGLPSVNSIVFSFEVLNTLQLRVSILSYEFELWLYRDDVTPKRPQAFFISSLSPDLGSGSRPFQATFEPHQKSELRLLWHWTPQQLQMIEDERKGKDPTLEIRGHVRQVFVDNTKFPQESFEQASTNRGYPYRHRVPVSEWIALLNEIGFKNAVLYELNFPPFPAAFARSQQHLEAAWQHHHAGRPAAALGDCNKALECVSYNLFGETGLNRQDTVERIMPDAPGPKKEKFIEMWAASQAFFHLGRHERGEPVPLDPTDSELALMCATSLLGYLAKHV